MQRKYLLLGLIMAAIAVGAGCTGSSTQGNVGTFQRYTFTAVEPQWIRDGEPIEFEGEKWYPQDGMESLEDSEVSLMGEYKGTQFFIDKLDVRPYARLYTKLGRNQFRFFEKRSIHD